MTALLQELREMIAAEGPLSIERYMALCLAHPIHGYYMTRDPFGAAGDFTTAPEVSLPGAGEPRPGRPRR